MPRVQQANFTGGEVSPSLGGRSDLQRFYASVAKMRNFLPLPAGGAGTRPGFIYADKTDGSGADKARLIPFVFNNDVSYVLEFTAAKMRVFKNGALLTGGTLPVTTPYAEADIPLLNYFQSGDILTIVHPSYPPHEVRRTGDTIWAITQVSVARTIQPPTALTRTQGNTTHDDRRTWEWVVTSVNDETGEESIPSAVFTDECYLEASGRLSRYKLSWTAPASGTTPTSYNIYRGRNGTFGFIGNSKTTSFWDDNFAPAYSMTPPLADNPFFDPVKEWVPHKTYATNDLVTLGWDLYKSLQNANTGKDPATQGAWWQKQTVTDKYPAVGCYFEQRVWLARPTVKPQTLFATQIGNYYSFAASVPPNDDDAITFTLAAKAFDEIRNILPLRNLIVITASGEYALLASQDSALTPTNISVKPISGRGSSWLNPIIIGDTALFVQGRGNVVRDLMYNFDSDSFGGNDLTVMARHLFDDITIVDWAYQQVPTSVVWLVRSDGRLLSLTYVKEHNIWGWALHETDGLFESVCVVPEGGRDVLYAVVRRNINGTATRCVEYLGERSDKWACDHVATDSCKIYDGRSTGSVSLRLYEANGIYTAGKTGCTLYASSSTFVSGDVGKYFILYSEYGPPVRCQVTAYTSGTQVTVTISDEAAYDLRNRESWKWARGVTSLAAPTHLTGKTLYVVGDGRYLGTVSNGGTATLSRASGFISIGLKFRGELETLDIHDPQTPVSASMKGVVRATVGVLHTGGFFIGPDLANLVQATDDEGNAIDGNWGWGVLRPNKIGMGIKGHYERGGRVYLVAENPEPLIVTEITREFILGV